MGLTPDKDINTAIIDTVAKMVSDPKLRQAVTKMVKDKVIFMDPCPSPLNLIKIITQISTSLKK